MLGGRIVQPGEPLWMQDDTDLAIALTEIEAERCDCGYPRAESMDPTNEYAFAAEAVRCHACAARERAARAAAKDTAWDEAGIRWVTSRR